MTGQAIAMPKPKRSMLPVLTVLFLVSYGLMALLVVEQGRTIDSQRNLIRQLFSDSTELSAMKGSAIQKHNAEAKVQAEANARSQAQAPSSQAPSSQAQSSQGTPRDNAKSDRKVGKARRPNPLKPPKFTSDEADERRALISI
jgi:cell division protein FtsN